MHRIDSSTAEADKFGAGKDGFTEGEPGVTAATETTDDWFDGVQEEIITPIEGMGITLVKNTRNQLNSALKKMALANAAGNWILRHSIVLKAVNLLGVCSGDDDDTGAVAVGAADGANGYALSSGTNRTMAYWAEYDGGGKNFALYAVAGDGAGIYVAVGEADGADSYVVRGTGHANWAEIVTPLNLDLFGVCYGTLWVAVGESDGADSCIITSTDGLAPWVQRGAGTLNDVDLYAVAYNGSNLYVAVGAFEVAADAAIFTSPDALTWTERSNAATDDLTCVAYGGGYWIAAGPKEVLRSADGITWADVTPSGFSNAKGVAYGEGVFVIAGTGGELLISIDFGATWIKGYLNLVAVDDVNAIAFSTVARCFVVVGDNDGTEALIATSHHVVI